MGWRGGGRKVKLASALVCLGIGASAKTIEISSAKRERSSKNADAQNVIQMAIDAAEPGDTVVLAPGMYYEDIKSFRDGGPHAPITIKGPRSAVVRGKGDTSVVAITHHHVHLEGFSIDGSGMDQEDADELDPDMYHRHLLHVHGGEGRVETVSFDGHEHRSGVTGFKGTRLNLSHARCTCIVLSNFVTHAELRDNDISDCGVTSAGCAAGHGGDSESDSLGQGLELGTPKSDFLAGVESAVDETAWNAVVDNSFSNVGGACVVVQQGAFFNLLDGNACMGSKDVDGAGFSLLGDANTFRNNYVTGGSGAGLAVGEIDQDSEDHAYGIFNQVHHNQLQTNERGALRDGNLPQPSGKVCQNSVEESAPRSLAEECNSTQTVPRSRVSAGGDDNNRSRRRGNRPSCRYVTIPPEHVSRCDRADVADDHEAGGTHWSRSGDNTCLEFTFANDDAVGLPTIKGVEITFSQGAEVATYFEVTADGEVVKNGVSSGDADVPAETETETFEFPAGGVTAEKIRYTAFGSKDANSDSAELEFGQDFSETVALCETTPREGAGTGRTKPGGPRFL